MVILNNSEAQAFSLRDNHGHRVAWMEYRLEGERLVITRTHIPYSGAGAPTSSTDATRQLLDAAAAFSTARGCKIEARCPYVSFLFASEPQRYREVMAAPSAFGLEAGPQLRFSK